jgi:mycofactocin precursor
MPKCQETQMADSPVVLAEPVDDAPDVDPAEDVLLEDVLVEEVSIDGMCGVY